MQSVAEVELLKRRKIEGQGSRLGAGLERCFVRVGTQTDIGVSGVVPRDHVTVELAVPSAGYVDTDRVFGQDLIILHLRSEIFFGVRIVQLIIIVRQLGDRVEILGELPFERAGAVAEPLYLAARGIARIERSVAIDRVNIIAQLIFVPDTDIYDNLLTVRNVGYAHTVS